MLNSRVKPKTSRSWGRGLPEQRKELTNKMAPNGNFLKNLAPNAGLPPLNRGQQQKHGWPQRQQHLMWHHGNGHWRQGQLQLPQLLHRRQSELHAFMPQRYPLFHPQPMLQHHQPDKVPWRQERLIQQPQVPQLQLLQQQVVPRQQPYRQQPRWPRQHAYPAQRLRPRWPQMQQQHEQQHEQQQQYQQQQQEQQQQQLQHQQQQQQQQLQQQQQQHQQQQQQPQQPQPQNPKSGDPQGGQLGATNEMMYTGKPVPQAGQPADLRATPDVKQVTLDVPAGVSPNIMNAPDMPCLDGCPEQDRPTADMTRRTIIYMIPKDDDNNNSGKPSHGDGIEVVSLGCSEAAPLNRSSMNLPFSLLPIVEDLKKELDKLNKPAPTPDGNMPFNCVQPPKYGKASANPEPPVATAAPPVAPAVPPLATAAPPLTTAAPPLTTAAPPNIGAPPLATAAPPNIGAPPLATAAPPNIAEMPREQAGRKKRELKRLARKNYSGFSIMALDDFGNYYSMLLSEWIKLHKGQP